MEDIVPSNIFQVTEGVCGVAKKVNFFPLHL